MALQPILRIHFGRGGSHHAVAADFGEQELVWEAEGGRWTAVLMNADGSSGFAADVNVGVKAGFLGPLALTLLIVRL